MAAKKRPKIGVKTTGRGSVKTVRPEGLKGVGKKVKKPFVTRMKEATLELNPTIAAITGGRAKPKALRKKKKR